jgi:hypothetical protein
MLHERLRNAWYARERVVVISPVLTLAPQGLVLGADTVLVAADGLRRLQSLEGQEARILVLLSAAYDRAGAPSVLGNIKRAAKAWSEGDDCLAYIHLAHARLPALQDQVEAARRLFVADGFMKAGTSPRAVFQALGFGGAYIDAIIKLFNPDQPRVPAGSGRTSGEWTREFSGGEQGANGGEDQADAQRAAREGPTPTATEPTINGPSLSLLGPTPAAAPESVSMGTRLLSWMADLDAVQIAELGAYASRVLTPAGAAALVFGILFVPSANNIRVEGEVADISGLRYSWNSDELTLHLTYDHAGEQRTFAAYLDGDEFRDEDGRVIGHVIGGNKVAIDLFAVLPDLVKEKDEPRMCPAPEPDVPGSDRGLQYEEDLAKQYEDFLKPLINPDAPTPSGYSYYLPYPDPRREPVSYDDCQKKASILLEFKGDYGGLLMFDSNARRSFLDQSLRQIAASGGRPVVWIFADKEDAARTQKLFENAGGGRQYITIVYVPWTARGQ